MNGRPRKEVAEYLGVCVTTVGLWKNLWDQGGKEALKPANKGRKSKVTEDIRADIHEIVEIKREIDGRTVTGYLIHGFIKKTPIRYQLFPGMLHPQSNGLCQDMSKIMARQTR